MPQNDIPCCLECNRITWSRQKILHCSLCNSVNHAKCLSYTSRRRNPHFLRRDYVFYCKNCIGNSLPFQSVNDHDLHSIFGNTIHDLVNIFNEIDDQILDFDIDLDSNIENCKYVYKHELENFSLANTKEQLSMIHVNIRSIYKNFDKLKILLFKFKNLPDIICLSETNIRKGADKKFIPTIEGYFFVRNDGTTNMGGAGIFIKNNLEYSIREDLFLDLNDCENIWVEIKLNSKKKIIVRYSGLRLP